MNKLKLGFPKGSLQESTTELFKKAGIKISATSRSYFPACDDEDLEIMKFKTNALPLYVIIDSDGNQLNAPMPTNLNVEEYKKWLDEGVAKFTSPQPLSQERGAK